MKKTIIKIIPNFPNYAITECGNIWSDLSFKVLKPGLSHGHFKVILCKNKKRYNRYVHRLVLETFVGPCPPKMECRHLDGNPQNNNLENLRWDTRSKNQIDAVKHGTHRTVKLTEQDVRMVVYMWRTKEFTQTEIAKLYDVTPSNIGCIVNKKSWKHTWKK